MRPRASAGARSRSGTRDACLAAGGAQQAAQHAEDGRFAGAVRPQQAEDLAPAHREADVVHGGEGAEAADQVGDRDGIGAPSPRPPPARGGGGLAVLSLPLREGGGGGGASAATNPSSNRGGRRSSASPPSSGAPGTATPCRSTMRSASPSTTASSTARCAVASRAAGTPLAGGHAETEHASLERGEELGRRSLRQQPALMQQQHVAAAGRLVEIGGGPHDGHSVGPPFLQHRGNDRPQIPARCGIHTDRRLVEQQQPRPRQQRAGQTELLLHPAGKLAGQTRGERAETGEAQQPRHALGAQSRGHRMQVGEQVEVLGDAQVLVEAEALRHVADRRMRQRGIGLPCRGRIR